MNHAASTSFSLKKNPLRLIDVLPVDLDSGKALLYIMTSLVMDAGLHPHSLTRSSEKTARCGYVCMFPVRFCCGCSHCESQTVVPACLA